MRNIVFDLDGTLLNTLNDLANSTNHALAIFGHPTHTLEEVRQMVGNGVANLIRRAMPEECNEEQFAECFAEFKQHYAKHCMDLTEPYEGIMPLLANLKAHGVKMAIVSNKLHSAVSELNKRFFSQYIDIALGETPEVNRKPAPDMLIKAMEQMGSGKDNTVYIGDSDVDIITAANAGIPCITVLWGFRDLDFLTDHGATSLAGKPSEILRFI